MARTLNPSTAVRRRRRLVGDLRVWPARAAALRPVEDLAAVIDDAAAVAAGGWAVAAPAQIVECAAVDAQELGGLIDGEKWRVIVVVIVIVEHGSGLQDFDVVNLCELEDLGE
jgi:hypothetical protein